MVGFRGSVRNRTQNQQQENTHLKWKTYSEQSLTARDKTWWVMRWGRVMVKGYITHLTSCCITDRFVLLRATLHASHENFGQVIWSRHLARLLCGRGCTFMVCMGESLGMCFKIRSLGGALFEFCTWTDRNNFEDASQWSRWVAR